MSRIGLKIAAATVAGLLAFPSMASVPYVSNCAPRDALVETLSKQFGEAPTAIGMVDASAVIEVFVSDQGTWTIISSDPQGNSCIVSAGEGWETNGPARVVGVDA